jgi:hypothetical protein
MQRRLVPSRDDTYQFWYLYRLCMAPNPENNKLAPLTTVLYVMDQNANILMSSSVSLVLPSKIIITPYSASKPALETSSESVLGKALRQQRSYEDY